jgi:methylated-DNA-[protein]-cysteine S-methyltransferase
MIYYSIFHTAAGWVGLQASSTGLRRVILPRKSDSEIRKLLSAGAEEKPDAFTDIQERLCAYFSGLHTDFPDKLDFSGATDFQQAVWQAARLIPYGVTQSYQWIAVQIGRPGAARAVGNALGKNPLPVIVPCHRVIASDGGIGGFTGGISVKRLILRLEGHQTSKDHL